MIICLRTILLHGYIHCMERYYIYIYVYFNYKHVFILFYLVYCKLLVTSCFRVVQACNVLNDKFIFHFHILSI